MTKEEIKEIRECRYSLRVLHDNISIMSCEDIRKELHAEAKRLYKIIDETEIDGGGRGDEEG